MEDSQITKKVQKGGRAKIKRVGITGGTFCIGWLLLKRCFNKVPKEFSFKIRRD